MKETVLSLQNVTKIFDNKIVAVDNLSLSILTGEVVGLVGPNGAGKSTLIKLITTTCKQTSGSINIKSFDNILNRREALYEVGVVPCDDENYPYLSGFDNLLIYSRLYGNYTKEQILAVSNKVGLLDRIYDKVKKYSTGMKKRLAFAKVMLRNPSLIILDEPFNGLDPEGVLEIEDFIKELSLKNVTFLIASHTLGELEQLCDRVVFMKKGKVTNIKEISDLDKSLREVYFDVQKST